jgi:hypothetical protein
LSGSFLGKTGAAAAEALARFLAEPSAIEALRGWFGEAGLNALLAHDGSRAGRSAAMERLEEAVDRDLATIDRAVSDQVDAVLRQDRLRRLEGSWRGLHWLAARLPPGTRCKVKMLSLRWAELCRDFERAVEFDQSQLFKKVYEEEFGTAGGEPFGLLCGDWEMRPFPGPGSSTDDIAGLDALAGNVVGSPQPSWPPIRRCSGWIIGRNWPRRSTRPSQSAARTAGAGAGCRNARTPASSRCCCRVSWLGRRGRTTAPGPTASAIALILPSPARGPG